MKLNDLYEHTPEQLIKARQIATTNLIKKYKITPPKWMARNWKYDGYSYKLIDSTDTKLPDVFSSAPIRYYRNVENTVLVIMYTHATYNSRLYKERILNAATLYISNVYQEVFGKKLERYREGDGGGKFFIYDTGLLPPELENAIQTKKLNIMDPITFQALHEIAKDQDAIK
jgi:hypothetical protein